ncbi:hypothetical protein RF55_11616 [Lasius niger]|uniref:Uncharacterized protein n=1 Tax=Lasius niger TaxID=67767 RepID=A0A0J7N867_LASNI|nr:hypothetical protein RF55_11616 [Lasius niger]
MDRETIERMSEQHLREETRRYGLSPPADRKQCIDLIMSQVDRNVPQLDFYGEASTPQVSTTSDTIPVDSLTQTSMPTNTIPQSSPTQAPLVQMCAMMLEQSKQQQILMQQLFAAISLNNPICSTQAATSNFMSTEEEYVEAWIHTAERVAQIHAVSNDILLFAATSKLKKTAQEMHRITSASNEISKKSPILNTKTQGFKVAHPPPSKNTSQSKDLFCVYCRAKGHLRDDCYKLKKKEKVTTSQPVSKVPSTVAAVEQKDTTSPDSSSSLVATVAEEDPRRIEINDSKLKVVFINNSLCNMWALLDTGSPISLIRPSIYK